MAETLLDANIDKASDMASKSKSCYLLTWNPSKWNWENYHDVVKQVSNGEICEDDWTCNSNAKIGDDFYLILLGEGDVNGIIGRGVIISEPYDKPHWDEEKNKKGETCKCVKIKFSELIDYECDSYLRQKDLRESISAEWWSPQQSGTRLKAETIPLLNHLWEELFHQPSDTNAEICYWTFKHKPGSDASANDTIAYVKEALKNAFCLCQYEYEFQSKHMVTMTWQALTRPKPGDIVFLRGDRMIYAVAKIIEPRIKTQANITLECQNIIKSGEHGENNIYRSDQFIGNIIFSDSPAFYESLDGPQNWGQRIDVDTWQFFSEEGVWIDEASHKSKSDIYLPIRELNAASGKQLFKELVMKSKGNNAFLLMDQHKNIILNGAPGTGKTYTARQMAAIKIGISLENPNWEELLDTSDHYAFVQFHPSYSYADFVEGLKPQPVPGGVDFKRTPGVFMNFCERARNQSGEYVFIIDEINRADLSRVFGELFFGLEESYRDKEFETQYSYLPGAGKFSIPSNITIIGTMNDIDRSVDSMDFALRRRFAWYEITADESKIILRSLENTTREKCVKAMNAINPIIANELGKEYQIGAAYFLNIKKYDGDFQALWDNHICIILNEYFRGSHKRKDVLPQLQTNYFEAVK